MLSLYLTSRSVLKGDRVHVLADDDTHWLFVALVDGDKCGFVPRGKLEPVAVCVFHSDAVVGS